MSEGAFLQKFDFRYFEKSAIHKLLRSPNILEKYGQPIFCESVWLNAGAHARVQILYEKPNSDKKIEFSCK
jgi:hypothetical protein